MSCLPFARFGLLLTYLVSTSLSGAMLSPATQNAIEQQQKAILEQAQQQRDSLRDSSPIPPLPKTMLPEATGQCLDITHIKLLNVTVLPLSVQQKLTTMPPEECMTLQNIQ